MSEPITIYCTMAHTWDARIFQPGDAMTLASPSLVRDLLATKMWSAAPLPPPPIRPPVEVPAPARPVTPRRRGKSKQ